MTAPQPETADSSPRWSALTVLPALTLLALVNLFASQALVMSERQAPAQPESAETAVSRAHQATGPEALPMLGQIQPFALTERSGAALSQAQLAGKVWVADFIFTSCTAECPLMSVEMQKLQTAFASSPQLRLVSFTVDPETDTPARLRDYAAKYAADAEKWLFATGEREALYQVAIGSFKLPVQDLRDHEHGQDHGEQPDHGHDKGAQTAHEHDKAHRDDKAHDKGHGHAAAPTGADKPKAASSPFLHSQKFVLVDDQLRIRGYYDSTDAEAMRSLVEKDLPRLLNSL